jgi:hypothetical protein
VQVKNLNYDAWTVVAFQRFTVIITELVMGMALLRCVASARLFLFTQAQTSFIRGAVDPPTQRIISASLFLHPGFLIVDHIHFQYNGFMFGILLWSILMARNVGNGTTISHHLTCFLGKQPHLRNPIRSSIKFQAHLYVSRRASGNLAPCTSPDWLDCSLPILFTCLGATV